MKGREHRWTLVTAGFLMGLTSLASVGCSHSVVVFPRPPERASAEKISLDIGLYVTDGFRNYTVSEYRMGDKWNYENLGSASATQLRLVLEQRFRIVEVVDERPPFTKPKPRVLHAVVEPAIEGFEFDIPLTKFQVYPAKIRYRITVYDMTGKVILAKTMEGIGDTKGSPGFDFAENPAKSGSKAIEDGARKALEALLASGEMKALVKE